MKRQAELIAYTLIAFVLAVSAAHAFAPPQEAVRGAPEEIRLRLEAKAPSEEAESEFREFKIQHGEEWTGVWNTVTQTPHRVFGQGLVVAESVSERNIKEVTGEFIRDNASFLGVVPQSLHHVSSELHGGRWYTDYQQVHDGLDVIGGRVHVRVRQDGRVTMFGSDFYPGIAVDTSPGFSEETAIGIAKADAGFDITTDRVLSSRLVILPVVNGDEATYHLAYEVRLRVEQGPAIWRTYVDAATGDVLRRQNEIYYDTIYGNITGYYKPMYITDPDTEGAFECEYITSEGYGQATSDATGYYSIEVGTGGMRNMSTILRGDWTVVTNNAGPEAAQLDTVPPGTELDMLWDNANSIQSERNAYYHVCVVHDWIKQVDPSYTLIDRRTPVNVNEAGYCNAYWDGNGITLGAGTGSCRDLAMFCDVIYHEYGHSIVDFQYRPYAPTGAMHEAFADYTACTITGEPYIGEGVFAGGYFRTMDNDLKYPDDLTGEVHDDGRILGGALWHMRENLWPDVSLADSLFHFARYGKADDFFDYYYDLLETDDDDGDLSNGTPHYYEIVDAFARHGIGPGLYIDIAHDPVKDSEVAGVPFPVTATVESNLNLNPDSIVVWYDSGGGWALLPMGPTGNPDEYSAEIPSQEMGATVDYYISAQAIDWPVLVTHPENTPAEVHSFSIGNDMTPPLIVHTAMGDQPDAGWPVTVSAEVTDNLGLDAVEVEYSHNGTPQTPLAMTRVPGEDIYEALLELSPQPGDFIEYRIKATDASAAQHVAHEPPSGYYIFGVSDADDFTFETGEEGWTHRSGGTNWNDDWHLTTQRNHTPGGGSSWKCGDTGGGDYSPRLKAFLESPLMTIGENARLTFWYWVDAEAYEPVAGSGLAWDGAAVTLVDSAGSATPIDPVEGYPYEILPESAAPFTAYKGVWSGHEGWKKTEFDLAFYQGPCRIRIKFGSDSYTGGEGMYVDDVVIWSGDALAGVGGSCDDDCIKPDGIPPAFALENVLPNPTRGTSTITFAVPAPARVRIDVYDIMGRLTAALVDETKEPGIHISQWNGEDDRGRAVAPGLYFVRMQASDFSGVTKVIKVK